MKLRELIKKNRSYRQFVQDAQIDTAFLRRYIDLARLSASARNMQPYKYILVNNPDVNAEVFDCLRWAGDLPDWDGPEEGNRPAAYIIILGDTRIWSTFGCDYGIAAQSIMLGASEDGFGGCILGSANREKLATSLNIPKYLEILLVLALGKPNEKVVLEELPQDGDTRYWRDDEGVHHVPKRSLEDLILEIHE